MSKLAPFFLVVGLILAPATFAAAQSRGAHVGTVVMPFDGPGSDGLRAQVHAALSEDARLEVAPLDEGAPGALLLVSGSTAGRGARRTFELVASDGEGNELATQSGRLGRGASGRRGVADATRALVDAAIVHLPPPPADVASTRPVPTQTPTDTPHEEEQHHDEAPTDANDPAILSLMAGVVIRNRTVDVEVQSGGVPSYDSHFYVEVAGAAELRPLAHDPGLARGLFVRAQYAHAVGLGTKLCMGASNCQQFETTFFRAYGDVGFLFDLGRIVELGAGVGFGYEAYQIADNPLIPGVEYPYLRPAVRGRVRILNELLVVDAEVGLRSLFSRDRLSTAFGPNGDSLGMDAGLGLTGLLDFGLTWRVDFSWASYWHSFAGGGTLADGTSAVDQGIRIGAMIGYGLR